ncbi:XdhC family protein [Microbacterium aureliae]
MLELARDLLPLLRAGVPVAAVTVTGVARSAPRGVGATMAVTADGAVIGSISGGCVESDAIVLAHSALATGVAKRSRFGFSDDQAFAAGLACGGEVDVLAYRIDPDDALVADALERAAVDRACTLALIATGADAGTPVALDDLTAQLDAAAAAVVARVIAVRDDALLADAYRGQPVLLLSHAPRPRLIILGAGEHAAALCRVGAAAGFAVTVCDAWQTLVTPARFPDADELVVALPHEYLAALAHDAVDARTAVCVLTHDERLDIPALRQALAMPIGFVGAMGARRTVAHRAALLREAGVDDVDLARLHSPLGLDLAGSAPAETALSVLAEIVASRHGGSGLPLRERTGALHRRDGATPERGARHAFGEGPDAGIPAPPSCAMPLPSPSPAGEPA